MGYGRLLGASFLLTSSLHSVATVWPELQGAYGTRHNSRLSDAYDSADLLSFLDLAYKASWMCASDRSRYLVYGEELMTNLTYEIARLPYSLYIWAACYERPIPPP